jgi:hypothetical protein
LEATGAVPHLDEKYRALLSSHVYDENALGAIPYIRYEDKPGFALRAADACAGAGFHEKGLEVALDIEQLLYEATMLLNAASLINRIARQS